MSEEKARAQSMRFQDLSAIMEVLDAAYDEGITHVHVHHARPGRRDRRPRPRAARSATRTIEFFPCMPYAHKYANAMTEHGTLGALRTFLPDEGVLSAAAPGRHVTGQQGHRGRHAHAHRRRDEDVPRPEDAGGLPPERRRRPAARASGFDEAFTIFADHVREQYDAEPGFITMNLPAAAGHPRATGHREPDRLLQHQQDRLPHVRRPRRLRRRPARPQVPGRSRCRCSPPVRSRRARRSSGSARSRRSSPSSSGRRADVTSPRRGPWSTSTGRRRWGSEPGGLSSTIRTSARGRVSRTMDAAKDIDGRRPAGHKERG